MRRSYSRYYCEDSCCLPASENGNSEYSEWKPKNADGSGASIKITNRTEFTVKIDGAEIGKGQIFPPRSSISLVDARAYFPAGSDIPIDASLLSPNLIRWGGEGNGFGAYWQRVEELSSVDFQR